jgi:putative intracellular protease/amidase
MAKIRKALLIAAIVSAAGAFSACATTEPSMRPVFPAVQTKEKPRGKVLFVASAAREQVLADGSKRATGTFLGEFYEPYVALTRDGYEVVVASVAAAVPAIDPESLEDGYWEDTAERDAARRFVASASAWRSPLSLAQARAVASAFDGLVVPGGQGMMVDLLDNADLHALLRLFADQHKPIGLVCHAPALLARLAPPHALQSRTVTSVSGFEEFYIETFVMGADAKVRGIGEQLEDTGYEHDAAFPGSEHALRDCNLVTSQNPFSTAAFSALYLEALRDHRRGARCVARKLRTP